jgi:hypothetical protein
MLDLSNEKVDLSGGLRCRFFNQDHECSVFLCGGHILIALHSGDSFLKRNIVRYAI